MKYPECVKHAGNVEDEKFALAESLFTEIPPRRGRPPQGAATLEDQLAEVATEIRQFRGAEYSVSTLAKYRNVADWAAKNDAASSGITWAKASWSLHVEAYERGELTFEQFAANPTWKAVRPSKEGRGDERTVRVMQQPASVLVGAMTPEQKVNVATEILRDQPVKHEVAAVVAVAIENDEATAKAAREALDRRSAETVRAAIVKAGGNPDMPLDTLGLDMTGIEAKRIILAIRSIAADVRGLHRRSETDQWFEYQTHLAQAAEILNQSISGINVPNSLEGIEL